MQPGPEAKRLPGILLSSKQLFRIKHVRAERIFSVDGPNPIMQMGNRGPRGEGNLPRVLQCLSNGLSPLPLIQSIFISIFLNDPPTWA